MKKNKLLLFTGTFVAVFTIGFSVFADESVIGDGVTPKTCQIGQLAKLTQAVKVKDKEQKEIEVRPGTEVHIINKIATDKNVTYQIYVGNDNAGKFISGVGQIQESESKVLDCQKPRVTI